MMLIERLVHRILVPVVKLAISPLALLQGIYVILTVPRLPEAPGTRQGMLLRSQEQQHGNRVDSTLRVAIVGDSAAAGVGAASMEESLTGRLATKLSALNSWCGVQYRMIAKSGSTAELTIKHLNRVEDDNFDVVVVSLGVNDVSRGFSSEQFVANILALNELLRSKFKTKLIVISEFPPVHMFPALPQPLRWLLGSRCRDFDAALAVALQEHRDCVHLRYSGSIPEERGMKALMASDGFHPGPEIYEAWAQKAAEVIHQRVGGNM